MASKGSLLIIGGHEDKKHEAIILGEIAKHVTPEQHLVLAPIASQEPREMIDTYCKAFQALGVLDIEIVDVRIRAEAFDKANLQKLENAGVVFFTGGDQVRLTSQLSGTPLFQAVQKVYRRGGMIAGTSAGAAAMSEVMIIAGRGDETLEVQDISMSPGLNFMPGMVIDSHFAERGRINRLITAIAQNPKHLGLGIDENTAILVNQGHFKVIGSGVVYVIDAAGVSYSSLAVHTSVGAISIHDVRIHTLAQGYQFSLTKRYPIKD